MVSTADLIEKEAELAWRSRQFDLSKLAKSRTHFGPLGALPPKEPPTEDPALRFVTRACNRPLLLPEVPEYPMRKVRSAGELRPASTPKPASRLQTPSRPGTVASKGEVASDSRLLSARPPPPKVSRYQKLITLYERAMLGDLRPTMTQLPRKF
mmetsp:Transcript_1231/g.2807  ORF Transcript_1231/g.2807 Transcript_1231/m.2807 type:complete len:154 (+) Transcript_1231:85-546(+)